MECRSDTPFCSKFNSRLRLFGSLNGAGICTSTTLDASIRVDYVFAIAFRDCLNGASLCASATSDAFITNNISHLKSTSLDYSTLILSLSEKKSRGIAKKVAIFAKNSPSAQKNNLFSLQILMERIIFYAPDQILRRISSERIPRQNLDKSRKSCYNLKQKGYLQTVSPQFCSKEIDRNFEGRAVISFLSEYRQQVQ